jgi:hypothetical protein
VSQTCRTCSICLAPVLIEIAPWSAPPREGEFLIHGVTDHGKPFRPSDWSERLCGVMACFRPGSAGA